jgi:hypothetical protein
MTGLLAAILVVVGSQAGPQQAAPPSESPFGISDNSFLVEEAFNQEKGVVQNIFGVIYSDLGGWSASFTQEWPLLSERHQLSYTVPFSVIRGAAGWGDLFINYRYQVSEEGAGRPAFSPRLSFIVPSSSDRRPLGFGGGGWQINLPFSKRFGRMYLHWNLGGTMLRAEDSSAQARAWIGSPFAGASGILAIRPMLQLMLECVATSTLIDIGERETAVTISPGVRGGWNFGETQVVVGFAVPVTRAAQQNQVAGLGYLSVELPFKK